MIHDILLSLLNPSSQSLPIEEFMLSNALSVFLHNGEKKILEDIVKIIHQHREIGRFTGTYGISTKCTNQDENSLQKGLYLQAFAKGIDTVLEKYLHEIADLEKRYLQNPSYSLLFIFHKINIYQPLFSHLQKLIRGLKSQRFHGCAIMQYLHKHVLHGNDQIRLAMRTIQYSVNVVFLKQLTHWLLYGQIVDTFGEFFIQCSEARNNSLVSERCTSASSERNANSDATSSYADIWRYEICYDLLPHYLSLNWAEKVLFIGQTVLMFKVDSFKEKKQMHSWIQTEKDSLSVSLWDDKAFTFFKKIEELQNDQYFNVSQYERVVDEIKSHVTERLSQIAVDQADLVKQLKLIKNFFLLGRGEFFLEFIKKTISISKSSVTENTARDLIKAFDVAAHSVNIAEELERFTFELPKDSLDHCETNNFGYLEFIMLRYKINWPLHLLFSPKVMERYNDLFRFLMLIKRSQYDLHSVWCHQRETRRDGIDTNVLQLRNQLMFLIDNLQYYIQADVLESEFSVLMNTVLTSNDFEHIQKAHGIFQANVLSLCFLLANDDLSKSTIARENPVMSIFNKMFLLCDAFCTKALSTERTYTDEDLKDFAIFEQQLQTLIKLLLDLLVNFKSASSSTPLSQLLLRLDYNHWFSTQEQAKENSDE